MQVAIDTSTDIASLALVKDGVILAELTWHSGQNHSVQLLPNLTHLFRLTGTDVKMLTAIIVAKGPGSFNGLRVGISAAKGLAFSLNIPIVGVNTLETAACQYADCGLPVCSVFNAGRSEIVAAIYRKENLQMHEVAAAQITTVEGLCSSIMEKTLFCGEHLAHIGDEITRILGNKAIIVSPLTDIRRAGFLAELGLQRLAVGDTDNVATLQPVYLRRPPITQAKHR